MAVDVGSQEWRQVVFSGDERSYPGSGCEIRSQIPGEPYELTGLPSENVV
jgi:hypothetical protein